MKRYLLDNITTDDGNYEYTISDNEVIILKYLGTESILEIPETIEDLPVTTLGMSSFIKNETLESITLNSITSIDEHAFAQCKYLTTVNGMKVIKLDAYSFYKCDSLKCIMMPNIKDLGPYCFARCIALESISLPTVVELPPYLFSRCEQLTNVSMPSIKTIGAFAFESCKMLEYVDIPETVSIQDSAFCYSALKSADFPKVMEIAHDTFLNCYDLEWVNLPTVTAIDDYAFMNSGARCVLLSKELNKIGVVVFTGAPVRCLTIDYGIEEISAVTEAYWYAFANKLTGLDVEKVIGRYIKNNVGSINFSKGDTEAPEITLLGDNPMTLEVGLSSYTEFGATVTDNSCEIIEPVISGDVNTHTIGKYVLTYTATDFTGNVSEAIRTVNVIDTTIPVIALIGESTITIEVDTPYEELGADVTDNSGEVITPCVNGFVDYDMVGQYKLTYTAADSSGNKAVPVVRIVNVVESAAIRCSQIVAYNLRGVITKWGLFTLDNLLVYESGNYLLNEEWIYNLDDLNIAPGTLLYLKAIVEGNDAIYPTNIKYVPSSYTAYFRLDIGTDSGIFYNGIVYSDGTPPLFNCVKVKCFYDTMQAAFRWTVLTLDNKTIFSSDSLGELGTYEIDLASLKIPEGIIVRIKAQVIGDDSEPYLHFRYLPGYNDEPAIELIGSAFKTCVMFIGVNIRWPLIE